MINEQFYFPMLLSFSVLSLVFIHIEMTSQIQITIAMKYLSVPFRDSLDTQKNRAFNNIFETVIQIVPEKSSLQKFSFVCFWRKKIINLSCKI